MALVCGEIHVVAIDVETIYKAAKDDLQKTGYDGLDKVLNSIEAWTAETMDEFRTVGVTMKQRTLHQNEVLFVPVGVAHRGEGFKRIFPRVRRAEIVDDGHRLLQEGLHHLARLLQRGRAQRRPDEPDLGQAVILFLLCCESRRGPTQICSG